MTLLFNNVIKSTCRINKLFYSTLVNHDRIRAAEFNQHTLTLPPLTTKFKIECIRNEAKANKAIKTILGKEKVFGVDIEWPPNFKKGEPIKKTSLVQICTNNKILIFQLSHMPLPIELHRFLQDKDIYKSGVDIRTDGLKLYNDFGITANGLVDLADLATATKSSKLEQTHSRSLSSLTAMFLNRKMAKGRVRISNWGRYELTPKQIQYAALDAYASYKLFRVMKNLLEPSIEIPVRHLSEELGIK